MTSNLNTLRSDILSNLNIKEFNLMQEAVIVDGVKGFPLIVRSPTGSGKTIAFLTVVLNRLNLSSDGVTALVIVPSRELALQIENVFRAVKSNFKIACCYGGHPFKTEQQRLQDSPALIIGTPGRIRDHVARNSMDLSEVDIIVLDEFDKLLELGFESEIEEIFKVFKAKPQVILSSATAVNIIPKFLRLCEYKIIDWTKKSETKLKLHLIRTDKELKADTLISLLAQFNQEPALVFCNHREAVDRLSLILNKHNLEHGIFYGDLEQIDREKSLIKFRSGAHNVLIATDLAARGLDIPEIKHVVHFQCPVNNNEFVHRNGRTARMHAEGAAYLILAQEEELPTYLDCCIEELFIYPSSTPPSLPEYSCIYVSAGKQDKISKGDILGFLTQACNLAGDDIGLISVLDKSSFVAIRRSNVDSFLSNLQNPKIKKMKVKIQIAS